jgi:hypothetical protein
MKMEKTKNLIGQPKLKENRELLKSEGPVFIIKDLEKK